MIVISHLQDLGMSGVSNMNIIDEYWYACQLLSTGWFHERIQECVYNLQASHTIILK